MKHIKTPVRVTERGNIADKSNDLIFEARGPIWPKLSVEAVCAINVYGALVKACEGAVESMDIAAEQFGDTVAGGAFRGAFLGVRRQIVNALALTKADQ